MAKNPGTLVVDTIRPYDTEDRYPTHDPVFAVGGWRDVESLAERDAISDERRRPGMTVYVRENQMEYTLGVDRQTWIVKASQGGEPGGGGEVALAEGQGIVITQDGDVFVIGVRFATDAQTIEGLANNLATSPAGLAAALAQALANVPRLDQAQTFEAAVGVEPVVLNTSTPSIETDAGRSNVFYVDLEQDSTLENPQGLVDGRKYEWLISQDNTGGHTLAFGDKFRFPDDNTVPSVSPDPGALDLLATIYDGRRDVLVAVLSPRHL